MNSDRFRDRLTRLAGVFLLVVPWLPLRRIFGPLERASMLVPPGEWALGVGIFVAVAWLLVRLASGAASERVLRTVSGEDERYREWREQARSAWERATRKPVVALVLGGLLACVLVSISLGVYGRGPLQPDSVAQLFQAKIFVEGSLMAPAPADRAFFSGVNMVLGPEGWYSQYPPGHPTLLALGEVVSQPWLIPLVLSLGTAGLLYGFVDEVYDRATALTTLGLLALCPFFWFLGAGFMSHVPALFFASLLLWALARSEGAPGRAGPGAVAGGALGALFLCRPLTAVAVGVGVLPVLVGWLQDGAEGRRWRRIAAFLLPAAGLAAVYLIYNAATTGHPLRPGYLELWGSAHGLGFHATPWGGTHTPLNGLVNELIDLSLLNLFLFEWPIPALLPMGVALAAGWLEDPWDRRLVVVFLAVPAAYFFYWHRDAFMGPRFLYAGLAGVLPLTARALVEGTRRLRGREVQCFPGLASVSARAWAGAILVGCFLYSTAVGIPRRYDVYASSMPSFRVDLVESARHAGLEKGLIFVPVSWGNRLIAELWGLGAPAGLVERTYRTTDHCELDGLVGRARREGWSRSRLTEELRRLRRPPGELVSTDRLNGDRTLRLARDRSSLPRRCRVELEYDRGGYTNFAPHLVENDPWLEAPFVIARDLRARNGSLRRVFPDRPAYLYRDGRFRRLEGRSGQKERLEAGEMPRPDASLGGARTP